MLTAEQLETYQRLGAVTIDGPLTEAELVEVIVCNMAALVCALLHAALQRWRRRRRIYADCILLLLLLLHEGGGGLGQAARGCGTPGHQ